MFCFPPPRTAVYGTPFTKPGRNDAGSDVSWTSLLGARADGAAGGGAKPFDVALLYVWFWSDKEPREVRSGVQGLGFRGLRGLRV